ncbi:MAG: hypothetical protein KIS94_05560 [Chitinophagales bacterium]|nr:hypothetical protein [Chitinophagales bacterium]
MATKKTQYREGRCRNACEQWFGAGTTQAQLCKGYCLITSNQYQNLPNSKSDYESRMQVVGQPAAYFRAPLIGKIPGSNTLGWPDWRNAVFQANTGCSPTGGSLSYGAYTSTNPNNPYNAYANILGQQLAQKAADEGDCDKWTGYSSKYINGVYYGTLQPVTLRMLYSYSSPYRGGLNFFEDARKFCDNLYYENGDVIPPNERPYACGGNGPNISSYNPGTTAMNAMQPEIDAVTAKLEAEASEAVKRITILWAIVVVIIIVVIMWLIWR